MNRITYIEKSRLPVQKTLLEHTLLFCLIAICASLVLLRSNPATNLPSRDGGVYAYVGSEIVRGKLPYIDAWESKPPGIFYLNALAIAFGGRWGVWLLEYLFILIAAWTGHQVMSMWWGETSALIGTLSWLSGLIFILNEGNYTEEYSLPLSFLAFWIFSVSLKKKTTWLHDFLIGLTAGLSFLLRANNIGAQIGIGFAILAFGLGQREYWKTFLRLLLIGLGTILPLLFVASYFALQGALQPMVDAALIYNFFYTGEHAQVLFTLGRAFLVLNIIVLIALVGYVTILVVVLKKISSETLQHWHFLLLIALPIEMFLSSLSGRAYNHYFISWLPILGLLCAFTFYFYGKRMASVLSSRSIGLTYAFLIVVLLIGSWSSLKPYFETATLGISGKKLPEQRDPVAIYVQEHTNPNDKVLVWGAQAGINFVSGREAPTPYFLYPLFIPSPITIPMADKFLEDIRENPPALVVDVYFFATGKEIFYSLDPTIRLRQMKSIQPDSQVFSAHNLNNVIDFIASNYHPEIRIDKTQIYRLNP